MKINRVGFVGLGAMGSVMSPLLAVQLSSFRL